LSFSPSEPRPVPRSQLFPYTTLFRSLGRRGSLNSWPLPASYDENNPEEGQGVQQECGADPRKCDNETSQRGSHCPGEVEFDAVEDRKSTRLNSSHVKISYAVFCLKKK